jgi:hypothetical protein
MTITTTLTKYQFFTYVITPHKDYKKKKCRRRGPETREVKSM